MVRIHPGPYELPGTGHFQRAGRRGGDHFADTFAGTEGIRRVLGAFPASGGGLGPDDVDVRQDLPIVANVARDFQKLGFPRFQFGVRERRQIRNPESIKGGRDAFGWIHVHSDTLLVLKLTLICLGEGNCVFHLWSGVTPRRADPYSFPTRDEPRTRSKASVWRPSRSRSRAWETHRLPGCDTRRSLKARRT